MCVPLNGALVNAVGDISLIGTAFVYDKNANDFRGMYAGIYDEISVFTAFASLFDISYFWLYDSISYWLSSVYAF